MKLEEKIIEILKREYTSDRDLLDPVDKSVAKEIMKLFELELKQQFNKGVGKGRKLTRIK
jgi:hypothetical protein